MGHPLGVHHQRTGGGNWRDEAACRVEDPELFFPVGDDGPALVQVAEAKAVCARCAVVAECLSYALVAISDGVAGGLTAEERAQLRRRPWVPATVGSSAKRRPSADELVVAALVAGQCVSGPSARELAHAAVALHLVGRGGRWIATRLGIDERRVYRWLERHRAGLQLTAPQGERGAGVSA